MWATRPAMTAAMGCAFRDKYPMLREADYFQAVLVRHDTVFVFWTANDTDFNLM